MKHIAETRRLYAEEMKQFAEFRKLRFELDLTQWEVDKWTNQVELLNLELIEHDKGMTELGLQP